MSDNYNGEVAGGQEAPPAGQEEASNNAAANEQQAPAVNMFANMNLIDENDSDSSSDDEENPMSTLPPYVLQRVEKLKELNAKRDAVMEQYLVDRAALEAKYHNLCEPLYQERADIIQGKKDDDIEKEESKNETKEDRNDGDGEAKDSEEQVDTVDTVDDADDGFGKKEQEGEEQSTNNDEGKVTGIPQFWVCAMSHMEPLAEMLTEEDVDCLESITDIRCVDEPDGTGFTLEFHFAPNDYFENSVLTKKYDVPNLLLDDEPILDKVEGCKIQWKSGQSLTFREITKKQRGTGKNAGMIRTVKKKERTESFFHFFDPPKMPSMNELDEDEADRLEEAFEQDYDVAQAFRSHIIPKAVMWFTGQVCN